MTTTLFAIILSITLGTMLSVLLAAFLAHHVQARLANQMVSFSIGSLLATSMIGILPHAVDMLNTQVNVFDRGHLGGSTQVAFGGLLLGFMFWFLLERLSFWRHDHHHEGDGHHHHDGFDRERVGSSGWMILIGSTLHNFSDGILIAAAFLVDMRVGYVTALSVMVHEIAHELSDFIVLLHAGFTKTKALLYNLTTSMAAVVGGVVGYYLLPTMNYALPYVLILAASSFMYIALSDLLPQLKKNHHFKQGLMSFVFMLLGALVVFGIEYWYH